ncbi:MAG: AAA family ATPase [Candidatus Scalindua sp.]|jgi:DNA sulfur modification protein DndD|nr:AAA family ATPase [Candidatus Scalindua sp.]
MIINSITMKNFQCYYGEHEDNKFEFTDGLNLIIGNNGAGKSKFYDAFYWVLNDKIFLSDTRKFISTREYKDKLISDRAKREISIGSTESAEVTLIATSATTADVVGKEYKITRIYKDLKTGKNKWAGEEEEIRSSLMIDERKSMRWVPVVPARHDDILDRIINPQIKPYMWFQGEQVDGLLDLGDSSTLSTVVNLISNIKQYDGLIELTEKGSKKAIDDLRKAQLRQTKDKAKADDLNRNITNYTKKIESVDSEIKSTEKNISTARENIDQLVNSLADAEVRTENKSNLLRLQKQIDDDTKALEVKQNGLHKKMFTDLWVLKNAKPAYSDYVTKYAEYHEKHLHLVNSSKSKVVLLPINIPQPMHVNNMLRDEQCFVCGRDAKKGTDEYGHIKSLLSRDPEEEGDLFTNDCSGFFQRINDNAHDHNKFIDSVGDSISNEYKKINQLQNRISEATSEVKNINDNFHNLLEDETSENVARSFRIHNNNKSKYESKLHADKTELDNLQAKLTQADADLKGLVDGQIDQEKLNADRIYKALLDIAKKTRSSVFSNLIIELQESANELFSSMTIDNNSITGSIKLKSSGENHYIPVIVDSEGIEMSSSNDSNIVLVKLSLIMAIIKSKGKSANNYTLISDAPTSKMAREYSFGFYSTLSDKFTQSIVTTYDFNEEKDWDQLKKFNIGKAYHLESVYEGGDRNDRSDLKILSREIV